MSETADQAWQAACLVAAVLAVDPLGLRGAVLHAGPGPVRDRWLAAFKALLPTSMPVRKMPVGITDDRLLGGLDLAASLGSGTRVMQPGLLRETNGGVLLLSMAERVEAATIGRITQAMDRGIVTVERDGLSESQTTCFGLVALDGSRDDEPGPIPSLLDRLAFPVKLDGIDHHAAQVVPPFDAASVARARAVHVHTEDAARSALVEAASLLGIGSLRAPALALRAARAHAALYGRTMVGEEDVTFAARTVLAPRATTLPQPETEASQQPDQPEDSQDTASETETAEDLGALTDMTVEAALAALPPDLLAQLGLGKANRASPNAGGRNGAVRRTVHRGRPMGVKRGAPVGGARLDLLATLRTAAPLQPLRRLENTDQNRIVVLPDDFRIKRFKQHSATLVIAVVDASGSAALHRMAEAKGAVELLLVDAYARRDQVALIAFRGDKAAVALPPTRALARAKRSLTGLAGGGGTPLASALEEAFYLAQDARKRGATPLLVVLTDGQANIARDGTPGRKQAREDAEAAARAIATAGLSGVLIDTGPRPRTEAESLARLMGARYLALPHANATAMASAVRAGMEAA